MQIREILKETEDNIRQELNALKSRENALLCDSMRRIKKNAYREALERPFIKLADYYILRERVSCYIGFSGKDKIPSKQLKLKGFLE